MSYSTVMGLWPRWPHWQSRHLLELRNGWGSGPAVWFALSKLYLGKECLGLGDEQMRSVCDLYRDPCVTVAHRAVLAMTFDYAYVERRYYARAAADAESFAALVPLTTVNHWPAIAELLRKGPKCPAVGLWCTSVGENLWSPRCVDWRKAWSVYREIDKPPAPTDGKEATT